MTSPLRGVGSPLRPALAHHYTANVRAAVARLLARRCVVDEWGTGSPPLDAAHTSSMAAQRTKHHAGGELRPGEATTGSNAGQADGASDGEEPQEVSDTEDGDEEWRGDRDESGSEEEDTGTTQGAGGARAVPGAAQAGPLRRSARVRRQRVNA